MKVIFKEHTRSDHSLLMEIKLHRPEALNALDQGMIVSIKKHLEQWHSDPRVSLVFLHGSSLINEEKSRAFCAGGDVKSLYSAILAGSQNKPEQNRGEMTRSFFENEYQLDYLLHVYPKPVVVWGHGLVMGGGLGLLSACSHRIVTETSRLSMPETAIGFFPDVGSSFHLSRMPSHIGWYMALTGAWLNSRESRFLGLADFYLPGNLKPQVFQTLLSLGGQTSEELNAALQKLQSSQASYPLDNWFEKNQESIEYLMASENRDTIAEKFQHPGSHKGFFKDPRFLKHREFFLKGSPRSMAVTCELFKKARTQNLKQVFAMDLTVALHCMEHSDFLEGVKALLVDKTGKPPKWKPASLSNITKKDMASYFTPPQGLSSFLQSLSN